MGKVILEGGRARRSHTNSTLLSTGTPLRFATAHTGPIGGAKEAMSTGERT